MSNLILFDDQGRRDLLPLSYTRPTAALRVGILTIREKWEKHLSAEASYETLDYLSTKYPSEYSKENLFVNGRALPSDDLIQEISKLDLGQGLKSGEVIIAARGENKSEVEFSESSSKIDFIKRPQDLFSLNAQELEKDFELITKDRVSEPIHKSNQVINPENIFIEAGAKVNCAILNASKGPIYIGKDAEVMEGVIIRGGLAMCNNSVLKLGAKIYGATTLGPYCKVGGEVNNVVFTGYSNKGHDGFMGNSVLGEWCNIGADTNTSNLKNNYAEVKLWNYASDRFQPTGLQFCGLVMGDHSKCGINTMFNTGTVIGVSANVYGGGFPRNFIPSFSWGGSAGFTTFKFSKVKEVAEKVMQRRKKEFDSIEEEILKNVFEQSANYRSWEKQP